MDRSPSVVLFDAGNTVVFLDPRRIESLFTTAGVPFDRSGFATAELEARVKVARTVTDGQNGTERDLWRPYFEAVLMGSLGAPVEPDQLSGVGEGLRQAHIEAHLWSWSPPEVVAALDTLLASQVRLGVITNADGRMESAIEAAGIRDRFETVVDSTDVGVAKPEPEIFGIAAERMGVDPADCLYVGDLFPVDVVGARSAGLEAVLVDPIDQFDHLPVARIPSVRDLPDLLRSVAK